VFATKTGRPLGQRNVMRALKRAQRNAHDEDGRPTFAVMQASGPVPRGAVPSFHGFRHHFASLGIAAGDSTEEISWTLGHKHSGITRSLYIQQIKTEERRAMLRAKMEDRYGSILGSGVEATDGSSQQQALAAGDAGVLPLARPEAHRST
jgi:hypothetical protein